MLGATNRGFIFCVRCNISFFDRFSNNFDIRKSLLSNFRAPAKLIKCNFFFLSRLSFGIRRRRFLNLISSFFSSVLLWIVNVAVLLSHRFYDLRPISFVAVALTVDTESIFLLNVAIPPVFWYKNNKKVRILLWHDVVGKILTVPPMCVGSNQKYGISTPTIHRKNKNCDIYPIPSIFLAESWESIKFQFFTVPLLLSSESFTFDPFSLKCLYFHLRYLIKS